MLIVVLLFMIYNKSEANNLLEILFVKIVAMYKKSISKSIKTESTTIILKKNKAKKLETKNILINEKNYKDLSIYFTRYVHMNAIKMLSLHYHELMGKIKEHEGKKYMMVNDYMLEKVLDKNKGSIGIVKFDDTKILIDTDDKLLDYITFRNVVILITCH